MTFPLVNAHTGKLENLTTQVRHCMSDHQGAAAVSYEDDNLLALVTFLGNLARNQSFAEVPIALSESIERGRTYFHSRRGQLNLACQHCHERHVGQMLRGNRLSEGHSNGYPLYRLEWQQVGSLHRRFRACDIGVRAEPFPLGSPVYIELELYLRQRALALPLETPAVRR